ncbi:MAG: cytochrome-c oxidase, cbb3-type subunit III [Polynucleobacter sp. 24-46-87]|uniref:cytochrome-c oxidase, cbb3-type subunit III n=1 Tax=unclassified Polynucleobacter TaxID=2640945 RepID=UPI000BC4A58F|nr:MULTISPECIES: cytochrome-c oxidase, cbb3-type subunit III [unclassified Polynucleobacter]OYY21667.1 MAG: cytochrome-c oxidase, cbb3-type subunit III [Polynucleobacter sp. 35-46-11]OZA15165.1 MAG: cytochrome-c oxidase, cbb3-type subunit III [Polynucleobacter sp. 24-46-87]OZA78326.1 MAG: cytochrome-c oxidase, cbb3-type subunit III [Polynucleobacter sp. 39-46-10]
MSDFFNSGWSNYIALVSLVGIVWCVWLLFSQRKAKVVHTADGAVADTGHVWDGDLRELNNPLPRWWMWMFLLSCIFGLIYLVLFPGLGSYPGVVGYSTDGALMSSMTEANDELKPVYAKYVKMDIEQVAADPKAREMGQRLFLNSCAQCHGSDAGGAKGFPNLTDRDWLYGGSPENIKTTLINGRNGVMPAYGHLESAQIVDLANYVRSLSGLPADDAKVARGAELFKANCVACHGTDGKGNIVLGAPNLTDKTWLYGGSEATIVETLTKGRMAMMPSQDKVLSPEKIHLLTAYVWGLSNNKTAAAK